MTRAPLYPDGQWPPEMQARLFHNRKRRKRLLAADEGDTFTPPTFAESDTTVVNSAETQSKEGNPVYGFDQNQVVQGSMTPDEFTLGGVTYRVEWFRHLLSNGVVPLFSIRLFNVTNNLHPTEDFFDGVVINNAVYLSQAQVTNSFNQGTRERIWDFSGVTAEECQLNNTGVNMDVIWGIE